MGMTKKQLIINIGGLSSVSKLPCLSFNLSAFLCNIGGKLARIKNSVCFGCYAMSKNYVRFKSNIDKAHHRKIENFTRDHILWVSSFIDYLNNKYKTTSKIDGKYFRWFDSGDLYNYDMLLAIVTIAKNTPLIKHWLPTKEYPLIKQYKQEFGEFPTNLIVRVSSPKLDIILQGQKHTSSVVKNIKFKETKTNRLCRAYLTDDMCKECRLCWNEDIKNIGYKYH